MIAKRVLNWEYNFRIKVKIDEIDESVEVLLLAEMYIK